MGIAYAYNKEFFFSFCAIITAAPCNIFDQRFIRHHALSPGLWWWNYFCRTNGKKYDEAGIASYPVEDVLLLYSLYYIVYNSMSSSQEMWHLSPQTWGAWSHKSIDTTPYYICWVFHSVLFSVQSIINGWIDGWMGGWMDGLLLLFGYKWKLLIIATCYIQQSV